MTDRTGFVWNEGRKSILAYLSEKLRRRIMVDQISSMANESESFGLKGLSARFNPSTFFEHCDVIRNSDISTNCQQTAT
ncbi:hypothetical protein TNCV_34161 [Trichonephila clavipes]|nr:hypothetical protein TNCV_34161 [Trichonephila clavipes]